MARITEAIRRRLAPTPTEREQHLEQRRALSRTIAEALERYEIDGQDIRTVCIDEDQVGPLGGLSDKLTIVIGVGEFRRHYVVSVYAYGQMAEAD